MFRSLHILLLGAALVSHAWAGPSFDCSKVGTGSIEALVCGDGALAQLDRELARAYAAARRVAVNEHPPWLVAEQRGWIKGRNDCWKDRDRRSCVERSYRLRTAELQARYRLKPVSAQAVYVCREEPSGEIVASYFATEPPTLIAERGDQVSLMYREPSASGTRYQGRNESLWEHQGEVLIRWGVDAVEMHCRQR